ncbi:MAG TPA: glycosyltransferase, partial [Leptospiraceae bacterium]|nr:glycosyltransferase [Leptospiraceae bacterium]
MKIWILLPAFNEEESLPRLLPKISKFCLDSNFNYEIVVVNDGSLDSTLSILQDYSKTLPVTIVNHV